MSVDKLIERYSREILRSAGNPSWRKLTMPDVLDDAFGRVAAAAAEAERERCAAELERVAADIAATPDSTTASWVARIISEQATAIRALK